MLSTVGTLDPPLGRVRLHVAWLLSAAIGTNIPQIYNELADLGTINVLLVSQLLIYVNYDLLLFILVRFFSI